MIFGLQNELLNYLRTSPFSSLEITQNDKAAFVMSAAVYVVDEDDVGQDYSMIYGNSLTKVIDHSGTTGMKAAVWENSEVETRFVAFAGTDPGSFKDIITDILQGAGFSTAQYRDAMDTAKYFNNYPGDVIYTGHSLGGGEAIASAAITGRQAIVFNPAAVHPNTVGDYSLDTVNVRKFYSSLDVVRIINGITPFAYAPGIQISLGLAGFHFVTDMAGKMGVDLNEWDSLLKS